MLFRVHSCILSDLDNFLPAHNKEKNNNSCPTKKHITGFYTEDEPQNLSKYVRSRKKHGALVLMNFGRLANVFFVCVWVEQLIKTLRMS